MEITAINATRKQKTAQVEKYSRFEFKRMLLFGMEIFSIGLKFEIRLNIFEDISNYEIILT